ncbi:MAG: HD domain-containing protein [Actinomycetales bacterium]|nr:HD domain-containing protein [Actinomycetales bacterium]
MPNGEPARLSERLADALAYAIEVTGPQTRKRSTNPGAPVVPYMAHLLGVASLVLDAGGDEDQAVAGLLHDAAEDHGGRARLADIRARFGDRVARIVEDCSDSLEADGSGKAPWEDRKREHLTRLQEVADDSLLVWAADKVHNGRAILGDLRLEGPVAMTRFNAPPDRVLWYYRANRDLLRLREVTDRLLVPFEHVVAQLESLLETENPTPAHQT